MNPQLIGIHTKYNKTCLHSELIFQFVCCKLIVTSPSRNNVWKNSHKIYEWDCRRHFRPKIANHVRNGDYKQPERNPQLVKFPSMQRNFNILISTIISCITRTHVGWILAYKVNIRLILFLFFCLLNLLEPTLR